ncbi:ABC transporter permease [Streptomyces sp. NPDC004610]|uniref:ABC transporter permease n=1 Tax=unclassified Streptomyces TaxID=2593676 RepID=UPI0033BF7B6B
MSRLRRLLFGAPVPIITVLGYYLWTRDAADPFYPGISLIVDSLNAVWLFEAAGSDVVPSLRNLFTGYGIATVAGVGLGLGVGLVRWASELVMPMMNFARSVPPLMLIPPMVLVFGVGDLSKVTIVALGSFFPVLLATIDGVRQTEAGHLDAVKAMRLRPVQRLTRLWLPSATPSMFAGLQTGLQFALVLMVASEMVASTRGIGYQTVQSQLTFNSPGVWSGIIVLAVLGFLLNAVFTGIRNRVLAWHIGMRARAHDA